VPLAHKNKELVDNFIRAAHAWLPRKAIVGLELGNEPSYWACTGSGGWDEKNHFVPGWQAYVDYFHSVAKRASGCDKLGAGGRAADPLLMGPAWDDTNTLRPELLEPIARNGQCYLKALTVHYYVSGFFVLFWLVVLVCARCAFAYVCAFCLCCERAPVDAAAAAAQSPPPPNAHHAHNHTHTHTHTTKQLHNNTQPYYRKKDFSAKALVSEDLMREGVRNLTLVVNMAKKVRVCVCVPCVSRAAATATMCLLLGTHAYGQHGGLFPAVTACASRKNSTVLPMGIW
jgi:hypothetical protein